MELIIVIDEVVIAPPVFAVLSMNVSFISVRFAMLYIAPPVVDLPFVKIMFLIITSPFVMLNIRPRPLPSKITLPCPVIFR